MNLAFLQLMSGPLAALLRYGITAGATYVAAKGILPGEVVGQFAAAAAAAVPAVIGAITSTASAKVITTAALPGMKVTTPKGVTVATAKDASRALEDPTWDNPNAR